MRPTSLLSDQASTRAGMGPSNSMPWRWAIAKTASRSGTVAPNSFFQQTGQQVIAIAQALVPELEARVIRLLGADRTEALREDLETIRSEFADVHKRSDLLPSLERANSSVTPHKATNEGSNGLFELNSWLCAEKRIRSGHRVYASDDLRRVYRIALLRQLGLPLSHIAREVARSPNELSKTITRHVLDVDHARPLRNS